MSGRTTDSAITVVPANRVRSEDLEAVFGTRGEAARCRCQWFQGTRAEFESLATDERAARLLAQTRCGHPRARTTSGLVARLDDEPAGWCAVEPRSHYVRFRSSRLVWAGRDEDPTDESVWAVVCFVTRVGFRRRGVAAALAAASVTFARERGARAVEGYPIVTRPGQDLSWGELYVGSRRIFEDAGFVEVSRPTARRAVMRIDFRE